MTKFHCKNCRKISTNDYNGFCSMLCEMEYCDKAGFIFGFSDEREKEDRIDQLEEENRSLEDEMNDLEDKYWKNKEELRIEIREEMGVELSNLRIFHKEYYHNLSNKWDLEDEIREIKQENLKLKIQNKTLEEQNKVLNNKYNRFQIMDI